MQKPVSREDLEAEWAKREAMWRRKLGRIRLGVEPIEDQLVRYRRVTWVLTGIPLALSGFFVTLFAVFGRPGVGAVLAAVLLAPIALGAWIDHALLVSRARRYLRERANYLREREKPSQNVSQNESNPASG